eukprot:767866-Hanusia_phi.AAC.1
MALRCRWKVFNLGLVAPLPPRSLSSSPSHLPSLSPPLLSFPLANTLTAADGSCKTFPVFSPSTLLLDEVFPKFDLFARLARSTSLASHSAQLLLPLVARLQRILLCGPDEVSWFPTFSPPVTPPQSPHVSWGRGGARGRMGAELGQGASHPHPADSHVRCLVAMLEGRDETLNLRLRYKRKHSAAVQIPRLDVKLFLPARQSERSTGHRGGQDKNSSPLRTPRGGGGGGESSLPM